MAKFNEKVLCLFHKDYKQLKKEANRRGIPFETMEKTTARIIWKDAYDAGYNEGRHVAAPAAHYLPANYYSSARPETKEYCFEDFDESIKYRFELTEDQVRAIQWFIDRGFFAGEVNFSEWNKTYENVGRI
jgi:hypothetical protein